MRSLLILSYLAEWGLVKDQQTYPILRSSNSEVTNSALTKLAQRQTFYATRWETAWMITFTNVSTDAYGRMRSWLIPKSLCRQFLRRRGEINKYDWSWNWGIPHANSDNHCSVRGRGSSVTSWGCGR